MVKSVLVLYGGSSAERAVSLLSGEACQAALVDAGYPARLFDAAPGARAILDELEQDTPDVVFNALHGPPGEDGAIQGLLNLLGMPYTHSGILASALALDKPMARRIFRDGGLSVAEGHVLSPAELLAHEPIARPFVIKPCNQGSSLAVHIIRPGDNCLPGILDDWSFGSQILVERYVPGAELTVAVLDGEALGVTEIVARSASFYDYNEKYEQDGADHILPARIPSSVESKARHMAIEAHRLLSCRGISRADFRYDEKQDELVILEVNTQPGMTEYSLVPEQADHAGIPFPQLCARLVERADLN